MSLIPLMLLASLLPQSTLASCDQDGCPEATEEVAGSLLVQSRQSLWHKSELDDAVAVNTSANLIPVPVPAIPPSSTPGWPIVENAPWSDSSTRCQTSRRRLLGKYPSTWAPCDCRRRSSRSRRSGKCVGGDLVEGGIRTCLCTNGLRNTGNDCTPDTPCKSCNAGYAMQNGKCVPCNSIFGKDCTSCSDTTCTDCGPSAYPDSNSGQCTWCNAFGAKCQRCTASGCSACALGHYMDTSGACVACSQTQNSGECKECRHFSSNGNAQYNKLGPFCESCTTGVGAMCTSCKKGFMHGWTGKCQSCELIQAGCIECTSEGCTQHSWR